MNPLISPYKAVLTHDPTQWNIYHSLAPLLPPEEQSHLYLKAAWHALDRQQYNISQEFRALSQQQEPQTFSAYLIDLELLRRQGRSQEIPKKLIEIADIFKRKSLPAEEVKARKRIATLNPTIPNYEKVIALYSQIGKAPKAVAWAQKLALLPRPKPEPAESKDAAQTLPPRPLPPPPIPSPKPPQPVETPVPRPIRPDSSKSKVAAPILSPRPIPQLPDIAFGKALWAKHFGDVGEEPPLPPDIDKILSSPCPIWPDKKVRETHLLVLVPQSVTLKGGGLLFWDKKINLTLKTLGELIQKPLQGNATKYRDFYLGEYKDPPAPQSHWALLSRDVIPGSRDKSYQDQKAQVAALAEKTHFPYEVPTILDAAVCILMEYVRTGTCLYGRNPGTYTRCQEKYDGTWNLVVGGFAPGGLDVSSYDVYDFDDSDDSGVAVLRKFF